MPVHGNMEEVKDIENIGKTKKDSIETIFMDSTSISYNLLPHTLTGKW